MAALVAREHLDLAHRLADRAGEIQRRYFRQPFAVDAKADASPVTVADREAEAAMRELIRASFPGHGILGEEHGSEALDAEFVWVLDPIDGTKAFVTGKPLFATLIALTQGGRPVLGIIDQAISRERWVGAAGRPTTLNGQPCRTRACAGIAEAALSTTSPAMFDAPPAREAFRALEGEVRLTTFGGDAYAYGLLADGHLDLIVEAGNQAYDLMALVPVVEGAGGAITDWSGTGLHLLSGETVIASGDARVHAAAQARFGRA